MIAIDTSVWIEFFRGRDQELINKLEIVVESNEAVALSCVFGELLQGVKDDQEEKLILEFWQNLPKIDESNLFVEAGKNSRRHKLLTKGVGLIDSYILSAVLKHNLLLWTFDKKLSEAYRFVSLNS